MFGTVLFGRMTGAAGVDRALGLFVNTLPLRLTLDGRSVELAVRETHARLAHLLRHEHASLALAQRCSAVPPPAPLFSALLNYRHTRGGAQSLGLPEVELLRVEERSNYPCTLSVDDLGDLGFDLDAQTADEIDPMLVCRFMHTALGQLVHALEQAPATAVFSLGVLSDAERRQVLHGWAPRGAASACDIAVAFRGAGRADPGRGGAGAWGHATQLP